MKFMQLLEFGANRVRRPEWPPGDYVCLPKKNIYGIYTSDKALVYIDGEHVYFTLAEIDDKKDGWEAVEDMSNIQPIPIVEIPFDQSREYILKFGKYRGMKLDDVAKTDEGLVWLDWILGRSWMQGITRDNILSYVNKMKQELDNILRED